MTDFKMPFEDIDDDLIENRDQVISTAEKALIVLALGFVKLIAWRVKRAKTYGDLYNIISFFKDKTDALERKYEDTSDEIANSPETIIKEVTAIKDALEAENEDLSRTSEGRIKRFLS